MFDESSLPRSFCREFIEARQSAHQITGYMSLVLGQKPLLDDWIQRPLLDDFLQVCKSYGLHVRLDALHRSIDLGTLATPILGREYVTTTSALGFPLDADVDGTVHVFVSRERSLLKQGMWYPVVIRNRLIEQPRMDTLSYGAVLGYPECCVRFFGQYNNWSRYSFLYEIYKNSGKGHHYLCNPMTKDAIYSYIYHMPCSFACSRTIELAGRLRSEIDKREPDFARAIDCHLLLPFLVFFERKFYAFEGFMERERLYYDHVYFPDTWRAGRSYHERLERGDSLHIEDGSVHVYRGSTPLDVIPLNHRDTVAEQPFLIHFERQDDRRD
jgi:hypothetical protein